MHAYVSRSNDGKTNLQAFWINSAAMMNCEMWKNLFILLFYDELRLTNIKYCNALEGLAYGNTAMILN